MSARKFTEREVRAAAAEPSENVVATAERIVVRFAHACSSLGDRDALISDAFAIAQAFHDRARDYRKGAFKP